MSLNETFETVNKKMELIDYIYYLQYEMEKDNITVETKETIFSVWDGSSFKVNGDEFTTNEFYEMLVSEWKQVTCNGEIFEYVGEKFESIDTIAVTRTKYDPIIQL